MSDPIARASHALSSFRDYTTSGAFALSLTRAQVSCLAMVGGGDGDRGLGLSHNPLAALMRKGLIVTLPNQADCDALTTHEMRLSPAGVLALSMVEMAGLTNGDGEAARREIEGLQDDLRSAREALVEVYAIASSERARRAALGSELERAGEVIAGLKDGRPRVSTVRVPLDDPLPDWPDSRLAETLEEAIQRGGVQRVIGEARDRPSKPVAKAKGAGDPGSMSGAGRESPRLPANQEVV